MKIADIFNMFLVVSASYGLIFSVMLFFSKNGKDRSIFYLNLLILAISFNNIQSWVIAKNIFQYKGVLMYVQIPWHFLIAPFFYVFLVNYLGVAAKTIKILYSIIPVFLMAILVQIIFAVIYQETLHPLNELKIVLEKYSTVEEIVSFIVSISVFSFSFYVLRKKEKLYINILSFDKLQWVYTFFKLGLVCYVLWSIALIIKVYMNFSGFLFSYYPLRTATTILIFWMGYQAIVQLQILKDRRSLRAALVLEKIAEVNLDKRVEVSSEFVAVENYILLHKKFTDPQLSRDLLAKEIDIGKNKLSSIINQATQKTFTDYINQMRVDLAKQLLKDEIYKNYTITSIGLESGFNSKSTFYYVFKKHTGKTPLQFKKEK